MEKTNSKLVFFAMTAAGAAAAIAVSLRLFFSSAIDGVYWQLQVAFGLLGCFIFLAWVFVERWWAVVLCVASCSLLFFVAWSSQKFGILLEIFLFLACLALAAHLKDKIKEEGYRQQSGLEEIEKDKNVLEAGIKTHITARESLKKKLRRFSELKGMIGNFSSSLDSHQVARMAVENAYKAIGRADEAMIYLVDAQKQELALAASVRLKDTQGPKSQKGDIFDEWVMKQRQPLIIEDTKSEFRFDIGKLSAKQPIKAESLISTPILSKHKVLGVLRLNSQKCKNFSQDDLRLLDVISNLAAVALENTMLYKRTEELSLKDGLTGAYVHRYFKERLAQDVTRCMRANSCLSLLMLDIDYFKAYNDKYGHAAGDIVLKRVADILFEFIGDSGDMLARYGGEEFALVLIEKNRKQAVNFAEAIRKKISQEVISLRRQKSQITVSIGVASMPEDTSVCEDLIKIADDALYAAKKGGRNKVCASG